MYICLTLISPVTAKSIKIIMQRHDLTWSVLDVQLGSRAPTRTVRHRNESLVSSGPDMKGEGHARWAAPGPCQFSPETPPQVPQSLSQHNHSHYLHSITQHQYWLHPPIDIKINSALSVSHIWQTCLVSTYVPKDLLQVQCSVPTASSNYTPLHTYTHALNIVINYY